jgi:two-component system, sensor histidine kinase LadS
MESFKKQLITLFLVISSGILPAQEFVTVKFFFDKKGEVSFENLEDHAIFQPVNLNEVINPGFNHKAGVWCKIVIYNPDNEIGIYRIVTSTPHLDYVALYDGDSIIIAGDRVTSNPNNLLKASFQVPVYPGEEKEFILLIEKHLSYLAFALDVIPEFVFQKRFLRELTNNSLFLGFFIAFLLLNIFLAISSGRVVHFIYILHVVGAVSFVLINSGFFKYALFPSFIYVSEFRLFLSIVNPVVFAVFIMLFLNTKEKLHVIYTITYILAAACLLLVPLFYIFFLLDIISAVLVLFIITSILTGILILLAFITTLLSYRYERRKSIYVLSAFFMIFIFLFLLILEYYAIIRIPISAEYIIIPGIYEVVLFGILLGVEYYRTFQFNLRLQAELLKKKDDELEAFSKGRIRERKQIASILHDQMSSQLLATRMLLRQDKKCQAWQSLKKLGKDIRFLSHSLMPLALEHGLLMDALQLQLKLFREAFPNKTIELYNFGFPERIEYPWIFDIYLVIIEAIQNAIKHSKSELVVVEAYDYETTFNFQVVDNGNGFDFQTNSNGFGLTQSRQIVQGYRGTFEIDSTPGNGTVVMISMLK